MSQLLTPLLVWGGDLPPQWENDQSLILRDLSIPKVLDTWSLNEYRSEV